MSPDDEHLIGKDINEVPKVDPGEDCNGRKSDDGIFQGYCGATAGKATDHLHEGRCKHHGGSTPTGMDSPNAIHGLRSQYLDDEDQEVYEQVSQQDNADLIQEEIWAIKTKLLRAAREAGGNDAEPMVQSILDDVDTVDEETIAALAKLLQVSQASLDRALGRLNDLVKTHHKITEGDTLNVEGGGGEMTVNLTREVVDGDE